MLDIDRMYTDAFYRSGLAKSVFRRDILENIPIDYYAPMMSDVFRLLWRSRLYPKFYMVFDAFMSHYKRYETVLRSMKKTAGSVWQKIMQEYIRSSEFYRLNMLTAGSVDLSIVAAYQLLRNLLQVVDQQTAQQKFQSRHLDQKTRDLIDSAIRAAKVAAQVALESVQEYLEGVSVLRDAASLAGSGGSGYSHEALSVLTFLERPVVWRKRVRMLKSFVKMFRLAMSSIPTSLQHMAATSVFGGVSGVSIMRDPRQIVDLTVNEHVMPFEVFALRLLSRTAVVYQRAACFRPVVFVDKSGSMAETMPSSGGEAVEKISVAAGIALAFHRKLNAEIYLFDTEVERVPPSRVVDVLLRISADGGTCVEEVLREIKRIGRRDYTYIVISDGIDAVPEDLAKEVASRFRVGFVVIPPSWEPSWLKHFRYVKVRNAEELVKTAIAMLS